MRKKQPRNGNRPRPEMGKKFAQDWRSLEKRPLNLTFHCCWIFFPFLVVGKFLSFSLFSHFGFRPVLHFMPARLILEEHFLAPWTHKPRNGLLRSLCGLQRVLRRPVGLQPPLYRAPQQEIRKMPFLRPKNGTFRGPHLDPFK